MWCVLFHTTGQQADVEQGLVAEFRRVVAEHGVRTSDSHPSLLEPADQPEELTVTVKGVAAQVAGGEKTRNKWRGESHLFKLLVLYVLMW